MLGPILDELSEEVDYKIVKIDVEEFPELSNKFSVRSIPTLLLFNDSNLKVVHSGFISKNDLIDFVENNK